MQLTETKDNKFTISVNGITLHSKYSPLREAEKFINQNLVVQGSIVILGAGLGYIFKVIKENYPKVHVISLPYNSQLGEYSLKLNPSDRAQWNREEDLDFFLQSVINKDNIKGLQVLEWSPVANAFTKEADLINRSLVSHIRRVNGNILTTARFGRRWLKNSIRNYINIDKYISDFKINRPIVITASGKSLENSIDLIKNIRDRITLISLSSSNKALEYNNIKPDITFSTDPGYYSKLHLNGYSGIISMPLTNSTSEDSPVLLINQGTYFENSIIEMANLPHINLGENGTVAGTALMFAIKYSKQKIYLMGQDLKSSDIQSHITPYTFDNLLQSDTDKVKPYYSVKFKRWINEGVTYSTYRDWFSKVSIINKDRIFRVDSNSPKIEGITDISQDTLLNNLYSDKLSPFTYDIKTYKTKKIRQNDSIQILNKWLKIVKSEEIDENPLFYLISTSHYTDVKNKALSNIEVEKHIQKCREESILFIERLLSLYGRQLL